MINQQILVVVALVLIVTECRICQCHLSAAVAGDPRHIGAKITRVSRRPTLSLDDLGGDSSSSSSPDDPPTFIKSPAYQLKHKAGKPSQFNGDSPFQSGGVYGTPSFSSLAPLAPSRSNWADGPSITFSNTARRGTDQASSDYPTFTPYIGPRALSNLDDFFEHVRENVHAMQQDRSGGGGDDPAVYDDDYNNQKDEEFPQGSMDYYAHLLRFAPPQYDQVVIGSGIDDEDDDLSNQGNRHQQLQQFHDMRPGFRWMPPASGAIGRGQLYKMKTRAFAN